MIDDTAWRARVKVEHPILGRLSAAMTAKPAVTPESQGTAAWSIGHAGEARVAEVLASCEGICAVHDRRIPGSTANIDHIAIAPSGVYVIDTKKYEGLVEARDAGGWLRADFRLYVNGRDRTKLVDAMSHQVEVVRRALDGEASGILVQPVLCFVDANWPRFRRHILSVRGVTVLWPDALAELLNAVVAATFDTGVVAETIARVLRPA